MNMNSLTEEEFISFINQINNIEQRDMYNRPPLYVAASKGFMNAAKLLCERGADVNACNNAIKYYNVLNAACMSGNIKLVEFLLDRGAKVVEEAIVPPYHGHGDGIICLLCNGHDDMVKLLLEKGWSPNSSILNVTLVEMTIRCRKPEIFKLVLEKGAKIIKQDIELITTTDNNLQFIDILLKSEKSPLLLEIIFSGAQNNLALLDDVLIPLCIQGASNLDNFDLTESFENLFAEQFDIDLIGN